MTDIGEASVLPDAQPSIQFGTDGRLSGTTGLNRFTGQFDLADDEVRVSPLATTRMAGSPAVMDQEARFLHALSIPRTFGEEGDGLVIGDGAHRVHLVRAGHDV